MPLMRGMDAGDTNPVSRLPAAPTSVADTKLSVLSSMIATCGSFFVSTRRENSGGIVSTPLILPLRRSVDGLPLVGILDGVEGLRAARDGHGQLAHADGRHAAVLIDDGNLQVLDVAAERVAQHDELHERHHPDHDDQHGAAAEAAQLAFDDGPGAMHDRPPYRRIMKAESIGLASCSASRRSRPV